jgi:hypothetical protein
MTDITCDYIKCENNINGSCTKYFIKIARIENKSLCVSYRDSDDKESEEK